MRTIARNSSKKIAAIKATIVKATVHSLAGNFESVEVPVDAALAAHQGADHARLYDNEDGTYTVHIHSNLWYKMFTQEALDIRAARAAERAARNAARLAQAPAAPARTAGPRVDITALAERTAEFKPLDTTAKLLASADARSDLGDRIADLAAAKGAQPEDTASPVKHYVVPTAGPRLTARHDVLGPYNTASMAEQKRDEYRAEGIECDAVASATRPVYTAPVRKEALTPAFVAAKQVPAVPYLGNECECGHLRGSHYLRQHCDVAFCDCQAFRSRALTVQGHVVTGVIAAVRPVGPDTFEVDIEQADGTVTTVRNTRTSLRQRQAALFSKTSDRVLIDSLSAIGDVSGTPEEVGMVRAWTIAEIERRYPEAGAAAAAAFDEADRVLAEEDRVVEVDYVAVLVAALPFDIR